MAQSNLNADGGENATDTSTDNEVPDVSHGDSGPGQTNSPSNSAKTRRSANEIFERLLEGRGGDINRVVFDTPFGEVPCTVTPSDLSRKKRWDTLQSLPNGLLRQASNQNESDGEQDVFVSADVVPGGDSVEYLEDVVKKTLSSDELSDGDLNSMIENDLADPVIIQCGIRILTEAFNQGQIGDDDFRFE